MGLGEVGPKWNDLLTGGIFVAFQELTVFQESLQTLKMARVKYSGSKEALEQFKPDWNEKQILVPLTG